MNVLFVASEVAPFAKTGGLADVAAALSRYLGRVGHDVRLVMPMYRRVRAGDWAFVPHPELQDVPLQLGERPFTFSISTAKLPQSDVDVWFVRCPQLYDRDSIYTADDDEHLRFALLQRAALKLCQELSWAPDVVHANDWHTGLMPLWIRHFLSWDDVFAQTKTVLTIHNIAYQGVFPDSVLDDLELAERKDLLYQEDLADGHVNFLKTGLLYADAITTVSETYAREITTEEYGHGLHDLLRARSETLVGIVNGADYGEWSPESDARIPARYTADDLDGKRACQSALCERLEIAPGSGPLVGIVSRLTAQKGFELLPDILPVLLQRNALRLAVLGSGEERYERYFDWLRQSFPGRVGFHAGYDDELAHWIEAGADAFLMPSRFEPCGLNQMYSLRYGTVPIVRRTGGLADTVVDFDPERGTGTGFVFGDFTADALYGALERLLAAWHDRDAWSGLVARGMAADWSWDVQGRRYAELYERLL